MMLKLLSSLSFLAFLTGCSDSDGSTPTGSPIGLQVELIAARGAVISNNDDIVLADLENIQVVRGRDGSDDTSPFEQIGGVTASGRISAGTRYIHLTPDQFSNSDKDDAHFLAFYPPATSMEGPVAYFEITGSEDILFAPARTAVYDPQSDISVAALTFEHQLAWVEVELVATLQEAVDIYGNMSSAAITVDNRLELVIAPDGSAELRKSAQPGSITLDFGALELSTTRTVSNKQFLIYPDYNRVFDVEVKFENMPQTTVPVAIPLEAGKKSHIVFTVTPIGISVDTQVGAWLEGNGEGNEIPI